MAVYAASVPDPEELRALISALVGRPVALRAPAGPPKPNSAPQIQAVYCSDDGIPRAVASLDVALAACLGAALVMLPISAVQEATRAGKMSELLLDCTREVFNVTARLLNKPGGMHLVLGNMLSGNDVLAPELRAKMANALHQKEYDLEVVGYGRGRIVFRAA
ncbi:MAG: hypothetical protein EXR71_17705 [Myxococcales bacterium]|nr:hypothetical protein [Myxococcales bacterium]